MDLIGQTVFKLEEIVLLSAEKIVLHGNYMQEWGMENVKATIQGETYLWEPGTEYQPLLISWFPLVCISISLFKCSFYMLFFFVIYLEKYYWPVSKQLYADIS